jgi:hypothetical protein
MMNRKITSAISAIPDIPATITLPTIPALTAAIIALGGCAILLILQYRR